MNIELRKLRHMSVLAEELNFARAAVKLNLTQSASTITCQSRPSCISKARTCAIAAAT
jgi:hypothetical protein